MFYEDAQHHIYRVSDLDAFPWLIHGFGTRAAQVPADLITVKQIHSSTWVAGRGRGGVLGEADAILENTPGFTVAVKTADCVPILLVDERRRAVAAVHAGWRGTVGQIARNALEGMRREFSTEPEDVHAALGPAIGSCCYEVGPEVSHHFGRTGRAHIDLVAANHQQLLEAGISAQRIYAANLCTVCRGEQFYSWRREKEAAGRMHSFVGIRRALQ